MSVILQEAGAVRPIMGGHIERAINFVPSKRVRFVRDADLQNASLGVAARRRVVIRRSTQEGEANDQLIESMKVGGDGVLIECPVSAVPQTSHSQIGAIVNFGPDLQNTLAFNADQFFLYVSQAGDHPVFRCLESPLTRMKAGFDALRT